MKILIVVAHADDETIAASSLMFRHPQDIQILHTTDSAPRNPKYFTRAGYSTREAYGTNRWGEFLRAMQIAGICAGNCHMLPIPDQDAIVNLAELVEAIRAHLHAVERIITHAYEGGHPDHDATALAVSLAVAGTPIEVHEYPGYHASGAPLVASVFLPHPSNPPVEHVVLTPEHCPQACYVRLLCFAAPCV